MGKQYDKGTRRTRRRPKSGNTHRLTQNDTQKISQWKTPGYGGIRGFWFKKFTSIHDRLSFKMNKHVPVWMTKRRTSLIPKDPSKGTTPNNYRPITC